MTLEQIHAEVEKLRNSRWRWRVCCALLFLAAVGFVRRARLEHRCANVYRAIAYELTLSAPDCQDRDDALRLLEQTDEEIP